MAWISEQKNANILYPGCCCVVTIPRKVCQSTLEAILISWPGHFSHSDTPQKFAHYRPLAATIKGQSRPMRGLTSKRPVSVIIRLALDRGKVTTADLTNTDPWVMSWPSKDNGGPWQYKILCHAIITCHVTQCYNVLHVTPVILRGLSCQHVISAKYRADDRTMTRGTRVLWHVSSHPSNTEVRFWEVTHIVSVTLRDNATLSRDTGLIKCHHGVTGN